MHPGPHHRESDARQVPSVAQDLLVAHINRRGCNVHRGPGRSPRAKPGESLPASWRSPWQPGPAVLPMDRLVRSPGTPWRTRFRSRHKLAQRGQARQHYGSQRRCDPREQGPAAGTAKGPGDRAGRPRPGHRTPDRPPGSSEVLRRRGPRRCQPRTRHRSSSSCQELTRPWPRESSPHAMKSADSGHIADLEITLELAPMTISQVKDRLIFRPIY